MIGTIKQDLADRERLKYDTPWMMEYINLRAQRCRSRLKAVKETETRKTLLKACDLAGI